MASRRATNNAVRTATSNTSFRSTGSASTAQRAAQAGKTLLSDARQAPGSPQSEAGQIPAHTVLRAPNEPNSITTPTNPPMADVGAIHDESAILSGAMEAEPIGAASRGEEDAVSGVESVTSSNDGLTPGAADASVLIAPNEPAPIGTRSQEATIDAEDEGKQGSAQSVFSATQEPAPIHGASSDESADSASIGVAGTQEALQSNPLTPPNEPVPIRLGEQATVGRQNANKDNTDAEGVSAANNSQPVPIRQQTTHASQTSVGSTSKDTMPAQKETAAVMPERLPSGAGIGAAPAGSYNGTQEGLSASAPLTAPNEPSSIGAVKLAADEEENDQHPIIMQQTAAPASGSSADSQSPGGAAVNQSQQAIYSAQQSMTQGGQQSNVQTNVSNKAQSTVQSASRSNTQAVRQSNHTNTVHHSAHSTTNHSFWGGGDGTKAYGIGGRMFMKSLAAGGDFANEVIGRVARGDIQTTGSITGEMATQALNSYMGVTAMGADAGPTPSYYHVEIGGGRISGFERAPDTHQDVQFCMYDASQYAAPQGEHTKVVTADGATWYKQYEQDAVDRKPYYAPDGAVAYNETIVKRMPNPPQRKNRL